MGRDYLYLYMADGPLDERGLEGAFSSFDVPFRLEKETPTSGIVYAGSDFFLPLSSALMAMRDDLGHNLSFLRSHLDTPLARKLVREGLSYFPNSAFFPSDVLLREFYYQDFSSIPLLRQDFSGLDRETYLTAIAYLRSGLDAKKAAEAIFVHRNTFSYRLQKFVEATGIDPRDYHNALLIELYEAYGRK